LPERVLMPVYTRPAPRAAYSYDYILRGFSSFVSRIDYGYGSPGPIAETGSSRFKNDVRTVGARSAVIRTPDYFGKLSRGEYVAPTPASGSKARIYRLRGTRTRDYGYYIITTTGLDPFDVPRNDTMAETDVGLMSADPSVLSFDSVLPNRALIDARLKLKEQSVNLAQAFAERRQTAALLEETLRKVAGCVSALRRKQFSKAVDSLELPFSASKRLSRKESAAKNWLALQYGWKPLLSDLHGAAEALRSADEANPNRYVISVRGVASSQRQFVPTVYGLGTSIPASSVKSNTGVVMYKARVGLDYKIDGSRLLLTAKKAGFSNPAVLAWELLPFSFVADWFLPIGNYLGQVDAAYGLTFMGGYCTQRMECVGGFRAKFYNGWWDNLDATASYYNMKWDRSVYVSEPLAKLPSFKNPVSGTHLANAAALLAVLSKATR